MNLAQIAVALACVAMLVAVYCVHLLDQARQELPSDSKQRALSTELADMQVRQDSLETQLRRLRSKYAMRDRKEREESDEPDTGANGMPADNDPEWKSKARVALVRQGKLNAKFHL